MSDATVKTPSCKELARICAMLTSTIGESIGALVGRELVVRPGEVELHPADAFVRSLPRLYVAARGAIEKPVPGKTMIALLDAGDAIAMGGLLMMTSDEEIAEKRTKGEFTADDATSFGELGNVLFAGFGNVLRDNVAGTEVRYQDQVTVKADSDATALGTGTLAVFTFRLKLGEYPESVGWLVLDQATAEAWNKAPLTGGDAQPAKTTAAPPRVEDEGLETIPAAPIRGTLAAFVMQPDVFKTLRRSCRRVGLELRRHGRGEIPNPAAHRNEIVLMDVPPGEDRRFDWCRRIKELSNTTKVVLLLHQPSRQRVTQAFLSRADAILGFPCEEAQLSQKLGTMIPSAPPEATPPAS